MNDRTAAPIAFLTLCLLALPASAGTRSSCAEAAWIEPGEVVRGLGRAAGEPDCFRLATPGAGLLMLEVAVPAAAGVEPLLTLAAGDCGPGSSKLGSLAATPSRRLLRVSGARDFLVCVGAQDPLLRLDDFRLETAFLGTQAGADKDEPIEVEPDGVTAGPAVTAFNLKDEPIEVEPDGFGSCPGAAAKDEPIEVEPDGLGSGPGGAAKDEPIEVEPDGLRLGSGVQAALCGEARRDDHADVFACATPLRLGHGIGGEISGPWGDDRDVFAFELAAPATVRIWLSGEVEAALGLYDSHGQRLAPAAGTAAGSPALRRVKTLGPGVYFVRVQGWRGAEGAYELEVAALARSW